MARVMMDERARAHVLMNIKTRLPGRLDDQMEVMRVVKKMTTLQAPDEAAGHYHWHVTVTGCGHVVVDGVMIKTFLSLEENYPGGTRYTIHGNRFLLG